MMSLPCDAASLTIRHATSMPGAHVLAEHRAGLRRRDLDLPSHVELLRLA